MELQAASRYTKLFCTTKEESVENHKLALHSYEKAKSFAMAYQKETGNELNKDGKT
jgi:hypothetical protein